MNIEISLLTTVPHSCSTEPYASPYACSIEKYCDNFYNGAALNFTVVISSANQENFILNPLFYCLIQSYRPPNFCSHKFNDN